jgi:hypothetical protein
MQHQAKTNGSKPVTIEVDGEPLGVAIPAPGGFRFLAVRLDAFGIDGRTFATIQATREAARKAVAEL